LKIKNKMKRQIKFRAKYLNSNEWIYGYLINDGTRFNILYQDESLLTQIINVDPNTICEFTNQFDANGKEIYEGDFYREENGTERGDERTYFVCVFLKELSRFAWLSAEEKFEYETTSDMEDFLDTEMGMIKKYSRMIKVIGNTIDNPNKLDNA